MARSDSPLSIIVAAARSGRVSANGARRWARRAAAGEDVTFMRQLARAGDGVTGAELVAMTNDVASILAGAVVDAGAGSGGAGEITDAEADLLFRPVSFEEAARRIEEAAARAGRGDYTVAELHAEIFGDHVHAAGPSPDDDPNLPTGPGGHQQFTGVHTHPHSGYGAAEAGAAPGDTHSHVHAHFGDASHDHHAPSAPTVPAPRVKP
jgi:hypothetical protein